MKQHVQPPGAGSPRWTVREWNDLDKSWSLSRSMCVPFHFMQGNCICHLAKGAGACITCCSVICVCFKHLVWELLFILWFSFQLHVDLQSELYAIFASVINNKMSSLRLWSVHSYRDDMLDPRCHPASGALQVCHVRKETLITYQQLKENVSTVVRNKGVTFLSYSKDFMLSVIMWLTEILFYQTDLT